MTAASMIPDTVLHFTDADLKKAIATLTARAMTKSEQRRIKLAAAFIGKWHGAAWTLKTPEVLIRSSTYRTTKIAYVLVLGEFMSCSCPAGRAHRRCWHLTLGSLLYDADRIRRSRERMAAAQVWGGSSAWHTGLHAAQQAVDEFFV